MTRVVEIPPERVEAWVAGFEKRHGAVRATLDPGSGELRLAAANGSTAELWLPWGPIADRAPADSPADPVSAFAADARRERLIGALIVRRARHGVAVYSGEAVEVARTDHHYVQGRTAAGGWSQHRFERRRNNQARKAFADAADDAVELLVPAAGRLEALITAGDRPGVAAVLADPRCRVLKELAERSPHGRTYGLPDPNRAVVEGFPKLFRAVRVTIAEAADPS